MQLSSMLTTARYYLDDDSSANITDAELTKYINIAYKQYYMQLVNAKYDGVLADPVSLDIAASSESIALPSDFYKCKTVYRVLSTVKQPLYNKSIYETPKITSGGLSGSSYMPMYYFRGSNLLLNPVPQSSETGALEMEYWANITELSASTSEPISGFISEWQEMIPLKAAIWLKGGREEDDTSGLVSLLNDYEEPFRNTIDSMTMARQYTEPFSTGGY